LWDDNTPGVEGGVKLYADEIVELALPCLQDRSWDIKKQGAVCIAVVAEKAYANTLRKDLPRIIDTLVGGLHGRTWEGKESVARALASVCVSCEQEFAAGTVDVVPVHDVLLREASKTAATYRALLLPVLAKFYTTFGTPDMLTQLCDALVPSMLATAADDEDKLEKEDQIEERNNREKVCSICNFLSVTLHIAQCG
jgi:proteasome component ECM29